MSKEFELLNYLHEHQYTTQRQMATRMGLSLGTINLLLKKMVRKGLVKMERLNARTARYILTPKGIKEKSRLTYNFIRKSYGQIVRINNAVVKLVQYLQTRDSLPRVTLYGPQDEVWEIIEKCLQELGIKADHLVPGETVEVIDQELILTWRIEDEDQLNGCSRVVNIMRLL